MPNMFMVGNVPTGKTFPTFVIAEIGQNHNGDFELAKRMISVAKECGVTCVKFQKTSLKDRFTKNRLKEPYADKNSFGATYGQHRAHLEFTETQFRELKRFAEVDVGIMFSASAMDIPSADFLVGLGVPFIKIGSGDANNPLLIDHIGKKKIPTLISTGMCDLDSVDTIYNIMKAHHTDFCMMHCISAYPTPVKAVNLAVIPMFEKRYPDCVIGYSGHEEGISIAIAAAAMGAKFIEKHFTLDKNLKGTDHKCSLDPNEMKALVQGLKEVDQAIGMPHKQFLNCEVPCHRKLGKTLVAAKKIKKGNIIKREDIAIKVSTPPGRHPKDIDKVIGKTATAVIDADSPFMRTPPRRRTLDDSDSD